MTHFCQRVPDVQWAVTVGIGSSANAMTLERDLH